MKFGKVFITVSVSFVLFFSMATPVLAAANPEANPMCWKEEDCIRQRKVLISDQKVAAEGWIQNGDPVCDSDWGTCLAGNVTKAQVSFGGDATFTDIGIYIKTVYNYTMVIIGILGVVVLIIAGAQWITSAGNSTTIAAAKKRIGGVIIGLFIAYMSYNILNTINPATINLRLPQIWLLRSVPLGEPPCLEQAGKSGIDYYTKLPISTEFLDAYKKIKPDTSLTESHSAMLHETWCGVVYNLPTPPGGVCKGSFCKGREDSGTSNPVVLCGDNHPCSCYFDAKSQKSYCKGSNLGGTINVNGTQPIEDWYIDNLKLIQVCKYANADKYEISQVGGTIAAGSEVKEYGFIIPTPEPTCPTKRILADASWGELAVAGYFISIFVNDFNTTLGVSINDTWFIGKKSCGSNKPIVGKNDVFNPIDLTMVNKVEPYLTLMIKNGDIWTSSDIKVPITCDINTKQPPYDTGLTNYASGVAVVLRADSPFGIVAGAMDEFVESKYK